MTDYASIKAINFSALRYLDVSPKLFKWRLDHPEPETEAKTLGNYIHVATLEPDRWASDFVTEPDFGEHLTADGKVAANPKATKSYKAALAEWQATLPAGARVVSAEDHAMVEGCARAIREHRVAGPLLKGGKAEHVIVWKDPETGLDCKARLDIASKWVLDIKSTRRQTVRAFEYDAGNFLYDGKMAFYEDGAVAAGLIPRDNDGPFIAMVQNCEPFDVGAFHLPAAVLEGGRAFYRRLLNKYVDCMNADFWPGIAPDLMELNVYRRDEPAETEESW